MLEVIRAHSKGWVAKLILTLITVPFALFGIDAYLKDAGAGASVAKVDGATISVQEYRNAMQSLRDRLQKENPKDISALDSPEVKQSVLDRLINTRLFNAEVSNSNFKITNEQLAQFITSLPEFQEGGKFSQEVYDRLLSQNQMTPSQFEKKMRGEMLLQQVRDGIPGLAFTSKAVENASLVVEHQQREVSVAEIKTADFISQVNVDPSEVKAYYEKHKDKFKVPEQVKLEYVMLSANTLIPKMQTTEDEAKKFYDENASKFQGDEQRRASHILIGFSASATPEAKAEAKKKAEQVLAEVKKNPAKFAELAKKYSQDPGSAEKGGDLGAFGRGAMVKPFEDAAFSMKQGDVSGLVQSDFGYHIIKLNEILGQGQGFEQLKPQIRAELMYQKALAKFAEQAEAFSATVYEQSSSLQPVADTYGVPVQKSEWMSFVDGAKFFKSDRLMTLVFSSDVLKDKRNTEAVEVSNNTLVSARVVDYKPSAPRSFDEVKGGIADLLKIEKATKLAIDKGAASLASLKSSKEVANLDWITPVIVDRKNAQGLTEVTMSNVFKVDTSKLPAYAGVADNQKGYLLIKVTAVQNKLDDEDAKKTALLELRTAIASEVSSAYIGTLKSNKKIYVNSRLMMTDSTQQ
ncbi:SurA N-terminal domain-containing protein [Candidatus Methylopumilus turicensis]|uniref:Periplasmic chaperone PpiD n=1 Tax=Candidatus Methylopumilus turicensis TaxID=1581680 RepID=A0A0B7IZX4_9PROT|nr:SurA N-terminal domain-containing protein [Candidatus Methylopumilus turicensis]CEN56062.1 PpiC-type peptidyl-prolyl cis-trans isomerase [Candidatus Methylopumilus turicensis]